MVAPAIRVAPLALRVAATFVCAVLLAGAGGKPPAKRPRPAANGTTTDGQEPLPPLDMLLPPDGEPEESVAVPPMVAVPPARPVASASGRPLHLLAGFGLDVAGAGFNLTGGSFVGIRRRFYDAAPLALEAGLRASYAVRIRQDLVTVASGSQEPAAVFFAHTGDVSFVVATALRPSDTLPLELGVEAGAGLAWRSGHQTLLDRTFAASGVGLATHVAATAGWRVSSLLLAGLRLEAAAQPQPVRTDAPVMPTDLGALRAMLTVDVSP